MEMKATHATNSHCTAARTKEIEWDGYGRICVGPYWFFLKLDSYFRLGSLVFRNAFFSDWRFPQAARHGYSWIVY